MAKKPTALTSTKKGLARFHELQGEYYNESAQRVKDYSKVKYEDLFKTNADTGKLEATGVLKAIKSQFSQSIDQFGTKKNPRPPGTTTKKTEYALERMQGGLERIKKQGFLSFDMESGDKLRFSGDVAKKIIQNDLGGMVWQKHIDEKQKYFTLGDEAQTELRKIRGEALPALDSETGYRGPSGRLGRHTDTHGTVDTHFDTQPGNLQKQEGYFMGAEGEGREKEPYFETDDPNLRYSGTKTKEGLVQVPKKQKSIFELKLSDIVDVDSPNIRETYVDKLTRGPKSPQSGFASETRLASIDPKVAIGESGADLDLERESFAQDMESRLKDTKPKGYEVGGPDLGEKVKTGASREMPKSSLLTSARRAGFIKRQATLKTVKKNYGEQGLRAYLIGEKMREDKRINVPQQDPSPKDAIIYPVPGKGKKSWSKLTAGDWVRSKKGVLAVPYVGTVADVIHGLRVQKESKKSGKEFNLGSFTPKWARKIAFGEGIPRS